MSLEHQEQSTIPAVGLDKGARVRKIFELLASYPNATTAEAAHRLVTLAFEGIENNKSINTQGGAMAVSPFKLFKASEFNGKTIYLKNHGKNLLLLGDNGAIHISRITFDTDFPFSNEGVDLQEVKEGSKPEFSKAGADGKDVWGNNFTEVAQN